MSQPQMSPTGRLLSVKEVTAETSLHRATIYRRMDAGTFPKPIPLGGGRVAWPERAIEAWKSNLMEAAACS